MIDPSQIQVSLNSAEATLRRSPEGREILDCYSHDLKLRGNFSGLFDAVAVLTLCLAEFTFGATVPSGLHKAKWDEIDSKVRGVLKNHHHGPKITASLDPNLTGINGTVDLMGVLANFVAANGQRIVKEPPSTPPPRPVQMVQTATAAPTPAPRPAQNIAQRFLEVASRDVYMAQEFAREHRDELLEIENFSKDPERRGVEIREVYLKLIEVGSSLKGPFILRHRHHSID